MATVWDVRAGHSGAKVAWSDVGKDETFSALPLATPER